MTDDYQDRCAGADFCQEFNGFQDVTFTRIYGGNPASRMIIETREFALIADLSPLTVGHLLFLPKDHFLSFAQAATLRSAELHRVFGLVADLYSGTFGPPVILEHGSVVDDDHTACITHAHWHLVPLSHHQITGLMHADGLRPTPVRQLDIGPWPHTSYYLVGQGELDMFDVCHPAPRIPRQYVRSLIGRCLGMQDPEWDYAVTVRRELLRHTMRRTTSWQQAVPP